MSDISENIKLIKSSVPDGVTVVAVSKTKPVEDIIELCNNGHYVFGENRVQEIVDKYPSLPSGALIHMIGHLQTNKVKYIIDKVSMIEGVDSLKLLRVISAEALKRGVVANILLQFHIAEEDSKFGFDYEEIKEFCESGELSSLSGVKICGVMGMATFTDDNSKIRREFKSLKGYFDKLKAGYFSEEPQFCEISMGMSGDYLIAIDEGSTMIRIGSAIFGPRNCKI